MLLQNLSTVINNSSDYVFWCTIVRYYIIKSIEQRWIKIRETLEVIIYIFFSIFIKLLINGIHWDWEENNVNLTLNKVWSFDNHNNREKNRKQIRTRKA